MNISSKLYEQKTLNNFHINTPRDNIIDKLENHEYIRNPRKLKRPMSSFNVKVPITAYRNDYINNKNKKTFQQECKKFSVGNLNNIDLDSLFEKQLQKLREINKSEEEEYKSKINTNIFQNKKEIIEEKKCDNINQINHFNKKVIGKISSFNRIKSSKLTKSRPISNYEKPASKLLPSIQTSSLINNNETNQRILSNKNSKDKKLFFNKINSFPRPITANKTMMHREYGHVPKYLKEMKIRAKLMKDLEKKKEEEKSYPKGTKLLSEEERIFTLQKLQENKKELENLVTKLPIASDSILVKNKRQKLFKELDEIEQAIITFSKNKVFVKIDN